MNVVPRSTPGPLAVGSVSWPKFDIGSDQRRSQRRPCEPGSCCLFTCTMKSMWFRMMSPGGYRVERHTEVKSLSVTSCGESPPCTQKNFPSTSAAIGREQKERKQASYTASEYLCRPGYGLSTTTKQEIQVVYGHSRLNVKYSVRWRHSWFPRSMTIRLGALILRA